MERVIEKKEEREERKTGKEEWKEFILLETRSEGTKEGKRKEKR